MQLCPICSSADLPVRFQNVPDYITAETFDIRACAGCGLGITAGAPGPEGIGRYYPARYRTNRQKQTAGFRVRQRGAEIARSFPAGFKGRVLDLGCGRGDFIKYMKTHGWAVGATEIDAEKVAALVEQGIDARTPDHFEDGPAWAGAFDAVTCWHVLEHVHDPRALLRQAWDVLKPGGFLDIGVPDFGSPQARRWGADWFALDVPRHLFHFNRANLTRLIEQAGFEPTRWRRTAIEYDLFGEIQSALNVRATRKNVLFEAMTNDRGDQSLPPTAQRFGHYARAAGRSVVAVPRFLFDVARGAGGTLWMTCQKAP